MNGLVSKKKLTLWYSMESCVSSKILSTSSIDITCWRGNHSLIRPPIKLETRPLNAAKVSHLMHFLQTIISNFQPINDLPLNLSKLQVLDLKQAGSRVRVVSAFAKETPPPSLTIRSRLLIWFSVLSRSCSWYRFFFSRRRAFLFVWRGSIKQSQ